MLNTYQSSLIGIDMTKINLGLISLFYSSYNRYFSIIAIVDISDKAQKVCKLWVALSCMLCY